MTNQNTKRVEEVIEKAESNLRGRTVTSPEHYQVMFKKELSFEILSYASEQKEEGAQEERQFILNVLDGVDIANEAMGLPSGTLAIRHALASRIIGTPSVRGDKQGE